MGFTNTMGMPEHLRLYVPVYERTFMTASCIDFKLYRLVSFNSFYHASACHKHNSSRVKFFDSLDIIRVKNILSLVPSACVHIITSLWAIFLLFTYRNK